MGQSAEQAVATSRLEHPPELADRRADAEADMPKAKAFFYVCAGILCLAHYHLGARSARAQAPAVGFVIETNGNPVAILPGGDAYTCSVNFPGQWQFRANVFAGNPAGRAIVMADERTAVASSGEVYWDSQGGGYGPWVNLGIPPGAGPTAAQQESFGGLKAKYRGER